MTKLSLFLAVCLIFLAAQASFAQDGKALVIEATHAMETSPLDKDTAKLRERAMVWIIQTDQVSVGLCGGVVALFHDKKNKNSADMLAGYTLAMAAFKLQNPEKSGDEYAAQLAGLESALKVYEAIIKQKPGNKNDTIQALLVKRDNGELAATVKAIDCSK